MKEITAAAISSCIEKLCVEAACKLGGDVVEALRAALDAEPSPAGRSALEQILQNAELAEQETVPMCQDTGLAVVWADIGQDVHIAGDFTEAVQEGVRRGYAMLRKSVLDPLTRKNTGDNTPAVLHVRLVPGDTLKLCVAPKGAGSENMSRVAMLKPAQGIDGVRQYIIDTAIAAGPNACPPIVVGVGVGGNLEECALLAKRALLRPCGKAGNREDVAALERQCLEAINASGIGPQGFGGRCFALAVHIETLPTHIACLPVAVNIQCHAARHAHAEL